MKSQAVETEILIQLPKEKVFDAIVNPKKIHKYFPWGSFDNKQTEFNEGRFDYKVKTLIVNESVKLLWNTKSKETIVEIDLEVVGKKYKYTKVIIKESSFELNNDGFRKAMIQMKAWTNFLYSLKIFLYINHERELTTN